MHWTFALFASFSHPFYILLYRFERDAGRNPWPFMPGNANLPPSAGQTCYTISCIDATVVSACAGNWIENLSSSSCTDISLISICNFIQNWSCEIDPCHKNYEENDSHYITHNGLFCFGWQGVESSLVASLPHLKSCVLHAWKQRKPYEVILFSGCDHFAGGEVA